MTRLNFLKGSNTKVRVLTSAISAISAVLATGGMNSAFAQEEQLEEVRVTGSRIVRRDFESSSPIVTVDSERFEQSSTISVETILNQMPQFTPAQSQFSAQGEIQTGPTTSLGIGTINLRGVSTNRSLVLVDGRRAQPANASLVVDLNTVPSAAIERVETITGGASSVYGADALAGVVNFVLKNNFEGVSLDAQTGITEVGDGEESRVSALLGMSSGSGNANIMVGVEWYERDVALTAKRDFYKDGWFDPTNLQSAFFPSMPAFAAGTAGAAGAAVNPPSQAAVDALFPQYPPGTVPRTSTFYWNKDGTPFVSTGTAQYGFKEQLGLPDTGDGFYGLVQNPNGTLGQNFMEGALASPLQRRSAFAKARVDITDSLRGFAQANFSRTEVNTFSAGPPPAVGGNWGGSIPNDGRSAIPAGLQTLLDSRDDPTGNWRLNRGLDFLGQFGPTNSSDVYQIMAGLEGDVGINDWTWEAYYSTGETNSANIYQTLPSVQRWQALVATPEFGAGQQIAVASNYQINCTSGLPIFYGTTASTSQDCIDGIVGRYKSLTNITQDIMEANVQGGLMELPAGELRFAAGISNRENGFSYEPSNPQASIYDYPLGLFVSNATQGSTEVSEIYGELLVPVIENVDMELGYRLSDYDTAADKVSTYKALISWEATEWLTLRGGYQVANRAPNTAELFQAETTIFEQTFASGDPCQVNTLAVGWGNTPDNPNRLAVQQLCAALIGSNTSDFGAPGSAEANSFGAGNTPFTGINGVTSGNPNLDAEKAETYTVGAIFQEPGGIEGLSASIDFYSIEITDAIATFSGYEIYQNCFNALGSSNPTLSINDPGGFCALIQRAETGGTGTVANKYLNTGIIETSGTDVAANWSKEIAGGGSFYVTATASFLNEFTTQTTPSSTPIEYKDTLGGGGQFKYRVNSTVGYNFADSNATLGLRMRYLPKVRNAAAAVSPNTPNLPTDAWYNFDLFGSITLFDKYQLRGGIDNLLNEEPAVVGATALDSNSNSTSAGYYDPLGRRYYVGVKMSF